MKKLCFLFCLLAPSMVFACVEVNPDNTNNLKNTYFINTQEEFNKWSNFYFPEGSKILFAAGESFTGQFFLRGSGSADKPNLATSYNKETGEIFAEWTDCKAIIKGEGKVGSAILLKNGSFWEINNIEVTNTNGTKEQQFVSTSPLLTSGLLGPVQILVVEDLR